MYVETQYVRKLNCKFLTFGYQTSCHQEIRCVMLQSGYRVGCYTVTYVDYKVQDVTLQDVMILHHVLR